jgi:hypothetical protein
MLDKKLGVIYLEDGAGWVSVKNIPELIAIALVGGGDELLIKKAVIEMEHSDLIRKTISNGGLVARNKNTKICVPFAMGGELEESVVSVKELRDYVSQFQLQVNSAEVISVKKKNNEPIFKFDDLRSNELTIVIIEDEFQITARKQKVKVSAERLGLKARSGEKHSNGVKILNSAAYQNGVIDREVMKQFSKTSDNNKDISNNKKRIGRLNADLKSSLGLIDKPIADYKAEDKCWQCKFAISEIDHSHAKSDLRNHMVYSDDNSY